MQLLQETCFLWIDGLLSVYYVGFGLYTLADRGVGATAWSATSPSDGVGRAGRRQERSNVLTWTIAVDVFLTVPLTTSPLFRMLLLLEYLYGTTHLSHVRTALRTHPRRQLSWFLHSQVAGTRPISWLQLVHL